MGIITGKYSAVKGFSLLLILVLIVGNLILVGNCDGTRWFHWVDFAFTAAFGIGVIKMLWDRWKDK